MARRPRPLWTCPKCGHRFVTPNMWHSCSQHTLAEHFEGKDPALRRLFDRFVKIARASGPVTVYAQKTRIVLQGRTRFAGCVVRQRWLDVSLWLKRPAEHPRLHRRERYTPSDYGLTFRLTRPDDIDAGLRALLAEAYDVGQQIHPTSRAR